MKRPICVHCGEPYGSRMTHDETVRRAKVTDPWPPYRGNHVIIKDVVYNDGSTVMYRRLWDRVTWSKPYEPFCKLRCALDYARKAYRKSKPMEKRK